jgi:hypothetical protein
LHPAVLISSFAHGSSTGVCGNHTSCLMRLHPLCVTLPVLCAIYASSVSPNMLLLRVHICTVSACDMRANSTGGAHRTIVQLSLCVMLQVFDLQNGQQAACLQAAADTVNGVGFSPCLPLLATSSGHRRYPLLPADGWDADSAAAAAAAGGSASSSKGDASHSLSMSSYQEGGSCNSLLLWRMHADWLPMTAPADTGAEEVPTADAL